MALGGFCVAMLRQGHHGRVAARVPRRFRAAAFRPVPEPKASVTITPGASTAVNLADTLSGMAITSGTDWNMAKVGATGADINLATVGKLSNITKDLAASQQFAQIDWTFAAGNTK